MNSRGIMNPIIDDIRTRLQALGTEEVRLATRRFFKEDILTYGLKAPEVKRIAREAFRQIKGQPEPTVLGLCEELWRSGYLEEAGLACEWSFAVRGRFNPDDFATFERWVSRYVNNWASCDTLCNHTVGAFLDAFPLYLPELSRWAVSPNRWMRRAAAVSLIVPAREGRCLEEVFQIADILLVDRDDMVLKGYGWMLKAAAGPHLDEVFAWVMDRRARMPRTSLRYAIEKMPPDMKTRAMSRAD